MLCTASTMLRRGASVVNLTASLNKCGIISSRCTQKRNQIHYKYRSNICLSVKASCPTGSPCLTNHPVRQTHALHWRGETFLYSNHKEIDNSCAFSTKSCQTCLCLNQMMTVRLGMLVSKSKLKSVTLQKEFAIFSA